MHQFNVEKMPWCGMAAYGCMRHKSNGCTPRFVVPNERKVGLAWQQSLHCLSCQFKSGMYKLYEVLTGSRGEMAATINVTLKIGLQDLVTSNTKMCHLLTSVSVPPPSWRRVQKSANKVAGITAQNTAYLKKREKLWDINIFLRRRFRVVNYLTIWGFQYTGEVSE